MRKALVAAGAIVFLIGAAVFASDSSMNDACSSPLGIRAQAQSPEGQARCLQIRGEVYAASVVGIMGLVVALYGAVAKARAVPPAAAPAPESSPKR